MPHAHRHDAFDTADHVARLELEGAVAAGIDARAMERCRAALDGAAVARIADLGCGPGVATAALAAAFPGAAVVAVDGAEAMVRRAAERGFEALRLDLDGDLSPIGPFDLGWASMVVHHAADERALLAGLAGLVRPGGVLCVLERAAPTTVRLADDRGRPGLWDRVDALRAAGGHHHAPEPGVHAAVLRGAGLEVLADEVLEDVLDDTRGPAAGRFAADRLRREASRLDPADRAALADLGDAVAGAEVRISRRLLLARR